MLLSIFSGESHIYICKCMEKIQRSQQSIDKMAGNLSQLDLNHNALHIICTLSSKISLVGQYC